LKTSSWTAIPDLALDKAVRSKIDGSSSAAATLVLISLYRIGRQAINLKEFRVDEDGVMWFPVGVRLISSYSGVSANHVIKVVGDLAKIGLLKVSKSAKKRTEYSLTLYSPSIQISADLYSQGTHSANTVYSSENHKGSLTTLNKITAKLGTTPQRADPKLARLIERVKAWRPGEGNACGLFISVRDSDYMKQVLDSIDLDVLNVGEYYESRLDLGKCWSWLKKNRDRLTREVGDPWRINEFREYGDEQLNPPIWMKIEETKPSEGWVSSLYIELLMQIDDCACKKEDMSWKKGFVLASRVPLAQLFKIPDNWDFKIHDAIKELRDYINLQFDILEY